jgi:glutathione peroxidase-family protein
LTATEIRDRLSILTKFLVDREGNVLKRYASNVKPKKIAGAIEKAL